MAKRLIVLRAGDDSLHSSWGSGDWQLIHTYYGNHPPPNAIHIKGGKWDGIYQLFKQQPELLKLYDTIWLPDDDIQTNARDIETMFDLHEKYHLQLSQPALTHDSFVYHITLIQNQRFILRYSDFIEIMMPCFSADLLRRILPLFKNNRTGQFLDYIWHRFCDRPQRAAAILDAIAMRHAKPVGRNDPSALQNKSQRFDDIKHIKQFLSHTPQKIYPIFYAGITKKNKTISSQTLMGWILLLGWISQLKAIAARAYIGAGLTKRGFWFFAIRFFRYCMIQPIYHRARLAPLSLI